jgi:hypothetical protein
MELRARATGMMQWTTRSGLPMQLHRSTSDSEFSWRLLTDDEKLLTVVNGDLNYSCVRLCFNSFFFCKNQQSLSLRNIGTAWHKPRSIVLPTPTQLELLNVLIKELRVVIILVHCRTIGWTLFTARLDPM